MLRLYVKSRPYLATGAILFLATFNTSTSLRVPMVQVPNEVYDRFLSRVEADDPAEELHQKADQGNALAAYYFALRHTVYCPRDLRIATNRELAFTYMEKAAGLSNRPRAEAVLALYHLNAWGTKENLEKAMELASQAKANGPVLGYRVLGECHLKRAEKLFKELWLTPAEAGRSATTRSRELAELEAEIQAALSNLGVAAERGNAGALKLLAGIHDQGDLGRPRNHRLATEYFKQAALRRDERAARTLAERYEQGAKVEGDRKLAYAWTLVELQLAEDKAEPRRRRDTLETSLTVAEKLGAQDQAAQWLAQMPAEDAAARARLDPDR